MLRHPSPLFRRLAAALLVVSVLASPAAAQKRDLYLTDVVLSRAVVPAGSSFVARYSVGNHGARVDETYREHLYLSQDAELDAGDVIIGRSHGHTYDLKTFDFHPSEVTAVIPPETAHGDYFVLFLANSDAAVLNEEPSNNLTAVPLQVVAGGEPDLTVGKLALSLTQSPAGNRVAVTYDVKNNGDSAITASYRERIYLSDDGALDATDLELAQSHLHTADLLQAQSHAATVEIVIPSDTASGTYRILVLADADQKIPEVNEANNLTVTTLSVTPGDKDLRIQGTKVEPSRLAAGQQTHVSWEIVNAGQDLLTESYRERVYLSADRNLDPSDELLDVSHRHTADLSRNERHAGSRKVRIPVDTAPGIHYLLIEADTDGVVDESREDNNVVSYLLEVTNDPAREGDLDRDLIVTEARTGSPSVDAGDRVTLLYGLENVGSDDILGVYRELIYLSTDGQLAGAQLVASSHTHTKDLLAGRQAHDGTLGVTIPRSTAPGGYFLVIQGDAAAEITESNEDNNLATVPIQVNPPSGDDDPTRIGRDLTLIDLQISKSIIRVGDALNASYVIENVGDVPVSSSFRDRAYLSTDEVLDSGDILVGVSHLHTADLPRTGGLHRSDLPWAVPSKVTVGFYYLIVKTDALNNVDEFDEGNNTQTFYLKVLERPSSNTALTER